MSDPTARELKAMGILTEESLQPADPWAHRSAKMRCESCMWYVPKKVDEQPTIIGRCRRRAPELGGWPAVFVDDWCGDHKLDENRV